VPKGARGWCGGEKRAAKNPPRRISGKATGPTAARIRDPQASVLIVGLAPAAHGGIAPDACLRGTVAAIGCTVPFTPPVLPNQANSDHRDDALRLRSVTHRGGCTRAADNKPALSESKAAALFGPRAKTLRRYQNRDRVGKIAFDAF